MKLKAEELLQIELNTEIKKGKFLIGLKQYLGGENDSFSKKKKINFITDKGFINLIYGCWLFCSFSPILTSNVFAEESLRINLNQELKKGNLLIGFHLSSCYLSFSPYFFLSYLEGGKEY